MQNLTKNQLENKEGLSWGLCFGAAFPADALWSSIAPRCPPLGPGHLRGSVPIKVGCECHLQRLFFFNSPQGWEENQPDARGPDTTVMGFAGNPSARLWVPKLCP